MYSLETYTDSSGNFSILNVPTGHYWAYVSAIGRQPSFYPLGWPDGAIQFDIAGSAVFFSVALVSASGELSQPSFNATVEAGQRLTQTLTVTNTGTGPLVFNVSKFDAGMPLPPPPSLPVPGLPRLDPQIAADMKAAPDGRAEFLVILESQADLNSAYHIKDWQARGAYVLDALRSHAALSQRGLRAVLTDSAVDYQPLYIINAVIVHSGDLALVNSLAARPDVAQIVANHQIAVEELLRADSLSPEASSGTSPTYQRR